VNFLNLRKNAKIPLAGIGETDEIPVKLALEVGKRSPDRLSGGVSVIARVIEGLADGIYPGRAYADALISFCILPVRLSMMRCQQKSQRSGTMTIEPE
jgi:hypothetical protein